MLSLICLKAHELFMMQSATFSSFLFSLTEMELNKKKPKNYNYDDISGSNDEVIKSHLGVVIRDCI
jgi:hypothetical protein